MERTAQQILKDLQHKAEIRQQEVLAKEEEKRISLTAGEYLSINAATVKQKQKLQEARQAKSLKVAAAKIVHETPEEPVEKKRVL